jgi:hypothetical protein
LVEWVKEMGEMPGEVRLVHGEAEGKKGMEKALESIQ